MQELNRPGHKADQQPSSSAVLKNPYNYHEAAPGSTPETGFPEM